MMSNGPVGFPEMAMVAMLKGELENLAKRPHWIRFLLGQLTAAPILARVINPEYIDRCVDAIRLQKLDLVTGYRLDANKNPCISVMAAPAEDQQFIGRYGTTVPSRRLSPVVYERFTPSLISGCSMYVSRAYKLQETLWKGVLITNGSVTAQVDGIVDDGSETIRIMLKEALPAGTSPVDWRAQSSDREFLFELEASLDEVTWQVMLHTNGTPEEHRLFATIVRICLKRGRALLDAMGYKEAVISQTLLLPSETIEPEWQTQFTVRAKYLEHWIADEVELIDPNAKIIVDLIAHPANPEGREDVILDENL